LGGIETAIHRDIGRIGARVAIKRRKPVRNPVSRALVARSRALFAMRTGDPAGALAILESHRRVM
jgi:hypothetical protein